MLSGSECLLRESLFRIAKTLYPIKQKPGLAQTQTDTIRILFVTALFAFVIGACAGAPAMPTAVPPDAPTLIPAPQPAGSAAPTAVSSTAGAQAALFDGKHAYDEYLMAQMNLGIRPAGSKPLRATGDYILAELSKSGWATQTQEFSYRGVPIRNIIGKYGAGQGPLIILGAHYDTRPRANMDPTNPNLPVPGANDGASGVAVLLELARTLDRANLKNEVWLAFFDAEDNGDLSACDLRVTEMQADMTLCDATPWTWSVGAEHLANSLDGKPEAVVIVDMIGDADQNIYYEQNSDKALQETLWRIASDLGYAQWFIPKIRWSMADDHTPFLQRGITAIDIIDFDYPPWHTSTDTADKVSGSSLERVGRVLETWLEGK